MDDQEITRRLGALQPRLGRESDRSLAKSAKLSTWRVAQHRIALGIEAHKRVPMDRDGIVCAYVAQHPDCGIKEIHGATGIPVMKLRAVLPHLVTTGRLTAQQGERRSPLGPLPLIYRVAT